jgi:hypothetical protein
MTSYSQRNKTITHVTYKRNFQPTLHHQLNNNDTKQGSYSNGSEVTDANTDILRQVPLTVVLQPKNVFFSEWNLPYKTPAKPYVTRLDPAFDLSA